MIAWQPIASAPKDGERVGEKPEELVELFYGGRCDRCGGCWKGYAHFKRRKMRVTLPEGCLDRGVCDTYAESELRAEINYLLSPKPPAEDVAA